MKMLNLQTYQEQIENQTGVNVIKFGADWCGPCRAYAPILEETAKSAGNKADFFEVNVDSEPELSAKFNVRSVPATFILKNGKVLKSMIGVQDKFTILKILDSI